jgi:hypothetical protein
VINYICAVAVLTSAQTSLGQEAAPAPSVTTVVVEPAPAANILPAGTAIDLVFVDPVDSKANKVGDIIAMKVADDVMAGSAVIIPAGTPVSAEVIHAAKARAMGKAGELIISARFIQIGDRQIPMKGFKFGTSGTGKSKLTESAVAGFFLTPLPLFIAGGEKHADPGTRAFAKLKEDFDYTAIIASKQVSAPEITPAQNTEGKNQ